MTKSFSDKLIIEILSGKWGSGETRKKKLVAAGYDYDAVQKRVNEILSKMKTRKQALKPLWDMCKTQQEWSYNARYSWDKWTGTIKSSKDYGTCITYPNVVAMRCGLISEGKGSKGILAASGGGEDKATLDSFWKASVKKMNSVNPKYWSSVKHPMKTLDTLLKEGKIKEGDIVSWAEHTTMYVGKDSKGNLLFNNAGHAAGISGDKPGSNRAVLNQKCNYGKKKVLGVYSINTFIVITNCKGGAITASNRYMAGQPAVISIKPNTGNVIKSIKVDGKDVKAANTITFSKIDAHHIIEVVCDKGTAPAKKGYTGSYPTVAEIKKETGRNYLKKGDKGASVTKLQNYLNWYSGGKFFKECGGADGIYGNNTLKYCKAFQEKEIGKGEGDGTVGAKTINAMKAVKK